MQIKNPLCLLLLTAYLSPVVAEEHRQHGAHVHGVGELNVVVENTRLQIELDGPAVNLLGFEHAPNTREQRETLRRTLARLKQGAELYVMPASAACRQVDVNVHTALDEHERPHGDDTHHSDHDEDHSHEHGEHTDIEAMWHFTCTQPEALDSIRIRLFDAFPMMQRLQVQFITPDHQGGIELTPSNNILKF